MRIPKVFHNPANILYLVLFFLFVGRLFLLGKGHLDDSDELPYFLLLSSFGELISLNIRAWSNMIFHVDSSFIETFVRLIGSIFSNAYADFKHIPRTSPETLVIHGIFNILFTIGISFVFYNILQRLGFSLLTSIAGILVLASLLNTNLYIRHLLAYDLSLLLHLIALYIVLKPEINKKDILLSGFLSGIAYFTYVGYFMFFIMILGVVIMKTNLQIKNFFKHGFWFILPFFITLLIIEIITRIAGDSYIAHSLFFAQTITQGSPNEGLIYIFIYFFDIEKWWGVIILVLFFSGCMYSFIKKDTTDKHVRIVIITGIAGYLLYGTYVVLSGQMVFYGRLLHMYYPIIILGVCVILDQLKKPAIILIALYASIHFIFTIIELNKIDYPRSMIYQYNLFNNNQKLNFESELDNIYTYDHQNFDFVVQAPDVLPEFKNQKILVNFSFFFHHPNEFMQTYKPYVPPKNAELILEKKHFMSHPAYTYEYADREGRAFFKEKDLKIKIYKVIN